MQIQWTTGHGYVVQTPCLSRFHYGAQEYAITLHPVSCDFVIIAIESEGFTQKSEIIFGFSVDNPAKTA